MGELASDNFDRANGGLGANWTGITGVVGTVLIVSNQAVGENSQNNAVVYTGAAWTGGSDQYAQITVVSKAATFDGGPTVRSLTAAETFYAAELDFGDTTAIPGTMPYEGYKKIGGTDTKIINGVTEAVAANDVLRIEATDTTIEIFRNGVSKGSISDSSIATGNPGFRCWQNMVFDDWSAGNFTPDSLGTRDEMAIIQRQG